LAIPTFLDGLYRYLDLEGSSKVNDRMEALFDLLKPVNHGLAKRTKDDTRWYRNKMGMKHVYCSSCGYQLLEDFFDNVNLAEAADLRVCAGCSLQVLLDREGNRRRFYERRFIEKLVAWPGYESDVPNAKAPLYRNGRSLVALYEGRRVDHNLLPLNAPREQRELPPLTEYGITEDSLQELPKLSDLMGDSQEAADR
jgi:hypothetical protein